MNTEQQNVDEARVRYASAVLDVGEFSPVGPAAFYALAAEKAFDELAEVIRESERTRWTERERLLVAIVEAVARADNDDYIGEIKVDIPAGGYPRQSLLTAARAAFGEGQ